MRALSRLRPSRAAAAALAVVLAAGGTYASLTGTAAAAPSTTQTNGTIFTDTSGNQIHAHGGGMIKVGAYYYWMGENRTSGGKFKAVSMYRSSDLRNWEFRNDILTSASAAELNVSNIERPKVIYNARTKQFVLWMHWENGSDYGQARTAVAVSSTVDGDYTYRGSFRPLGYDSRDMTVYVDDDGTAYLISATRVNADLNIYRLNSDYTGVSSLVHTLWRDAYREAPAMFKRGSTYFLMTSGATGWNPNQAKYATASSISGTWSGLSNVGDSTTYRSQSTYVVPVQGTSGTTYLYMGDRWAGAWNRPVNESSYVWLRLEFPSSTAMTMANATNVTLDVATGTSTPSPSSTTRPPTSTPSSSPPSNSPTPVVPGTLTAVHSAKCLDVADWSSADGGRMIQYACHGGDNQKFSFRPMAGGYVQVVARHSGKCLDVPDASTANNVRLIQWSCGTQTNQQFTARKATDGSISLFARHSGKCVDVVSASTADDAEVIQYPCNGAANQRFRGASVVTSPSATPTATASPTKTPTTSPSATPTTPATATKKGWSGSSYLKGDLAKVKAMNVSWAYDWGSTGPSNIADIGAEYVPMVWGAWATDDATIARLKAGGASGRYKNVLAFNEPDHTDQANMTVDQAIALWPKLQSIGLPLGAPAVATLRNTHNSSTAGKPWIEDFMDKAIAKGYRVDFIPVHFYEDWTNPGTVDSLKHQVTRLHEKYKKPIWVTEIGTIDIERAWGVNMVGPATFEGARSYMGKVLPMLDSLPFVARYTWFVDTCWKADNPTDPCNYTSLHDNTGTQTALGKTYSALGKR